MTASHQAVLEALWRQGVWTRPYVLAGNNERGNAGAIARLLRTLCGLGLAEQRQCGWFSRARGVKLYEYQVTEQGAAAVRNLRREEAAHACSF